MFEGFVLTAILLAIGVIGFLARGFFRPVRPTAPRSATVQLCKAVTRAKEISIMMDTVEKSKRSGTFTIAPGREIYGELSLAGPKTSLYVRDEEYFDIDAIHDQTLNGVLHDLKRVTLIDCITPQSSGSGSVKSERYFFGSIFPHYVVEGDQHISPAEKTITEVHFVIDDATTLFYDFDAFGTVSDARPLIKQIVRSSGVDREIETGPHPEIVYFTGKTEIFTTDTILGRVSASHNPGGSFGGPRGVSIENTIFVTLHFEDAVTFHDTINNTYTLLRYFEILVGRPQNLTKMTLRIGFNQESPIILQVYWSMLPKRERSDEERMPHPSDVLLDPIRHPEEFPQVLANWLDRNETWGDARGRFFGSFDKQNDYDIDRLISSANMFDILPSTAVPPKVELPERLEAARDKCRSVFRNLPESPERESVLNALGRIGTSTLKQKIRYRAQLLIDEAVDQFPELFTVTDEAVNSRNHYVHGSEARIGYHNEPDISAFLTDTLEFVFAASDLIEAGWDANAWCKASTTASHPFGRYRIGYLSHLRRLKSLLSPSAATSRTLIGRRP